MDSIKKLCKTIIQKFYAHTADHVFTIAISGIDASGKGYVSKLLEAELKKHDLKIANINLDPWQNPIHTRLQKEYPAENFYENGFRWNDVFEQLIIPLRKNHGIQLTTNLINTHADEYYDFIYSYDGINILLIEGIFLLQQKLLQHYDFKVWIDCSFEVGMKRAIQRNAEKLDEQQLIQDYNTYYYRAQRYHSKKDQPLLKADYIYDNNE